MDYQQDSFWYTPLKFHQHLLSHQTPCKQNTPLLLMHSLSSGFQVLLPLNLFPVQMPSPTSPRSLLPLPKQITAVSIVSFFFLSFFLFSDPFLILHIHTTVFRFFSVQKPFLFHPFFVSFTNSFGPFIFYSFYSRHSQSKNCTKNV